MNIFFATLDQVKELEEKYTILELDTITVGGLSTPQTAWCLTEKENFVLQDMGNITVYKNLHNNLIKNYKKKNWKFCEDALEHLVGKWQGELDSFYVDLSRRIKTFKENDPGPDWTGVVVKHL